MQQDSGPTRTEEKTSRCHLSEVTKGFLYDVW